MEQWNEDVVGAVLMLVSIPLAVLLLMARRRGQQLRERPR